MFNIIIQILNLTNPKLSSSASELKVRALHFASRKNKYLSILPADDRCGHRALTYPCLEGGSDTMALRPNSD